MHAIATLSFCPPESDPIAPAIMPTMTTITEVIIRKHSLLPQLTNCKKRAVATIPPTIPPIVIPANIPAKIHPQESLISLFPIFYI